MMLVVLSAIGTIGLGVLFACIVVYIRKKNGTWVD